MSTKILNHNEDATLDNTTSETFFFSKSVVKPKKAAANANQTATTSAPPKVNTPNSITQPPRVLERDHELGSWSHLIISN